MICISWSSDFMLHLEDNLMYYYHILELCDLYFIVLTFCLVSPTIWYRSVIFIYNDTVWPKLWPQKYIQISMTMFLYFLESKGIWTSVLGCYFQILLLQAESKDGNIQWKNLLVWILPAFIAPDKASFFQSKILIFLLYLHKKHIL